MLGWKRSAAMPIRSTNPISKRSQGGLEARKALCFEVDNKSIHSEPGQEFFKSNGTKLECL
jgi:hypothetical protein